MYFKIKSGVNESVYKQLLQILRTASNRGFTPKVKKDLHEYFIETQMVHEWPGTELNEKEEKARLDKYFYHKETMVVTDDQLAEEMRNIGVNLREFKEYPLVFE